MSRSDNKSLFSICTVPPHIEGRNLVKDPKVIKGKVITLHCPATGIPFPNVTWLRDGRPLKADDRIRIRLSGRQLEMIDVTKMDTARYTCLAQNIAGETKKDFDLSVLSM